jgi:hypothetical protein
MNHSHSNGNKNQNSNHDSKHMWWMMLGCLLPLLVILFARGGSDGTRNTLFVVAGVGMLALHFFGMRGHGHQKEEPTNK